MKGTIATVIEIILGVTVIVVFGIMIFNQAESIYNQYSNGIIQPALMHNIILQAIARTIAHINLLIFSLIIIKMVFSFNDRVVIDKSETYIGQTYKIIIYSDGSYKIKGNITQQGTLAKIQRHVFERLNKESVQKELQYYKFKKELMK